MSNLATATKSQPRTFRRSKIVERVQRFQHEIESTEERIQRYIQLGEEEQAALERGKRECFQFLVSDLIFEFRIKPEELETP